MFCVSAWFNDFLFVTEGHIGTSIFHGPQDILFVLLNVQGGEKLLVLYLDHYKRARKSYLMFFKGIYELKRHKKNNLDCTNHLESHWDS